MSRTRGARVVVVGKLWRMPVVLFASATLSLGIGCRSEQPAQSIRTGESEPELDFRVAITKTLDGPYRVAISGVVDTPQMIVRQDRRGNLSLVFADHEVVRETRLIGQHVYTLYKGDSRFTKERSGASAVELDPARALLETIRSEASVEYASGGFTYDLRNGPLEPGSAAGSAILTAGRVSTILMRTTESQVRFEFVFDDVGLVQRPQDPRNDAVDDGPYTNSMGGG